MAVAWGTAEVAAARPFPYLLLPSVWASRNRARRRERGDLTRAVLFGGIAVMVTGVIGWGAYWVTTQLEFYAELGDYLIRLGLSWLFLTFLSFLAFSSIVWPGEPGGDRRRVAVRVFSRR